MIDYKKEHIVGYTERFIREFRDTAFSKDENPMIEVLNIDDNRLHLKVTYTQDWGTMAVEKEDFMSIPYDTLLNAETSFAEKINMLEYD